MPVRTARPLPEAQRSASRLSAEWSETTLGELADYVNGYAFKPADWQERGLPIIRIAQLTDPASPCDRYAGRLPEKYLIHNGDLIFSWSATLMTSIWDRGPAYLNQHLFKVVPRPGTDLRFLHHLLNFKMDTLAAQAHGTTMRHIKRSDLLPFRVVVPREPHQRAIASILDTVDQAIHQTEHVVMKLRLVRRGLLHDLLSRGIDENGELRDPGRHPERFKESSLGRIPTSWRVGDLDSLAVNHDRRRVPLKQADRDKRHGPYPYYGASGIIDWVDDYLFDGAYILIGEDGENVLSRRLPLAFSVSGRFWVNNHAHILEPLPDINIGFLCELLEATDYARFASGSAQPKLTQEALRHIAFAVPEPSEQQRIAAVLGEQQRLLSSEAAYLDKLILLRDGLARDLLTGRVHAGHELSDGVLATGSSA